MKFATILREAGFSIRHFKKCAEIPVILYDGKDRIESNDDIHFVEKLFANNSKSFMDLYDYLRSMEKNPPESINVKIDDSAVVFYYKTPNARIFSRKTSMEPIDYMD